jgi:hypothetical protein
MGGAHCGEGFPPESDVEYDFQPRPIKPQPPAGPIVKKEFRDRFYTYCEDCSHRWHHRQMQRWVPTLLDQSAIKVLPKRQFSLEVRDGKREDFWGLMVRERLSWPMVSAYIGLLNLPPVLFFFLWILHWGHDSDLSNASVPPVLSLTLTVAFVGWILQTHERGLRTLP